VTAKVAIDPLRKWSVQRSSRDNVEFCDVQRAILVYRDKAASTPSVTAPPPKNHDVRQLGERRDRDRELNSRRTLVL